jgi:hypothetical protein
LKIYLKICEISQIPTNKQEETTIMNGNTVHLSPEILQQLEYWKIDKAAELAAIESRRERETWIVGQIGTVAMSGMSKTLHTEPGVDITFKQERVFDQVALTGVAARRPYLVGSLLRVEYKIDGRQLNTLLSKGQDEGLKAEVLSTFTTKEHRTSFREAK